MLNSKTYYFIPRTVPDLPQGCFLLPNYDEYGIAYAEREAFYDPSYTTLLTSRGNATFQHLILVDGRIVGTWRREIKKKSVIIQTNFFATPSPSVRDAIQDEADKYGAFLNLPVELQS